jgi:hypothetical protein
MENEPRNMVEIVIHVSERTGEARRRNLVAGPTDEESFESRENSFITGCADKRQNEKLQNEAYRTCPAP